jgi:DNA-binding MarR family transcriptional regulator
METKNLKTLQLLEAIAEDKPTSQRELSDTLQISLGLVNSFIKRLVKKGYCKVTTIPKNRVRYILTPAGAVEKSRLTYQYISSSYHIFKSARNRLQTLYKDLQSQGKTRIVFYGSDEIADIAFLSMTGTNMRLIDVVDPEKAGHPFADLVIQPSSRLMQLNYDVLLITTLDHHETIVEAIADLGVAKEKICFL